MKSTKATTIACFPIVKSSTLPRVPVSVWSTISGWGLEVDGCNNTQQQACYNLLLPPEDAHPHAPREGEGLTLTVLNQRNAAVVFHKVRPLCFSLANQSLLYSSTASA